MTDFKRYSSLDNHYQTKQLMRWLGEHPQLESEKFILEEKVDGANLQVTFFPDGTYKIGKRSAYLKDDEDFYDARNVVAQYDKFIEHNQKYVIDNNVKFTWYGEIYGSGIQKRINYGDDKQLAFFDLYVVDNNLGVEYWMDAGTLRFIGDGMKAPMVPIIDFVTGLSTALEYDREFKSKLSDDQAEGFVIKPFNKHYFLKCGSRFVFKAKSDKFAEKMKVQVKERKEVPENVLKAFTDFQGYVTDNRLDNVIGNHGPFEKPNQIGDYIRYMMDDMKKDFQADGFDESKFEKDELKQIYNVGHKIVPLLKARL